MKRIYSITMMLALIMAPLSFSACGDDDDEFEFKDSETIFSITIDDNLHEYDEFGLETYTYGNWDYPALLIGLPIPLSDFRLEFPKGTRFSTFSRGYRAFEKDAVDISIGEQGCSYVSGTAKVQSNDGECMVVKFNNYKFTWLNGARKVIFNGTLTFDNILDYDDFH